MLFLWSTGSLNPQNKEGDATFDGKEHDAENPKSAVNLSPSSSALSGEQDDMTKRKDKGKSHVEYFIGNRELNADFEDYSKDSGNDVSGIGPIVPTVGQNYSNNSNPISAVGPSKSNTSPTHGKSSLRDAYQPPDMLEREDIAYSDNENVGTEADFNNLETSITVSPIPTIRTHKAHPISQIIGDLSSTTQTRKEPKRVYQALKDPSWIESMREELLQYKMQKVWILVDLPHGKRAIAYASFMGFMVYQMDVKSEFLYGTIEEEVYVCQPPRFEDPDHPEKVYKVVKALYEKPLLKDPDGEDVDVHIQRSMIVKRIFRYLKGKPHLGLWYSKDSPFDLVAYSNSDYGGASLDIKSTTRGFQFLRCRLISWQCKKQTVVATSSTEAEYIAGDSCYAQVLWIQNQMLDCGFQYLIASIGLLNP
nr:putative ribonuclease H-like domain-containing protein [Tanacetum cinerariifolium]